MSEHVAFKPRKWKRYCTHCRTEEEGEEKKLLQCARCKNAVYCSRECQKNNWTMHKRICKKLNVCVSEYDDVCKKVDDLESGTSNDELEEALADKMEVSSRFAQMLMDHAYFSTDTIERGAVIYEKAMRMLLWCVDRSFQPFENVQCLLVLAACLEYDEAVMVMINALKNQDVTSTEQVVPSFEIDPSFEYTGDGADLVYTCLLLIHVRRLTQFRDKGNDASADSLKLEENVRTTMDICVKRCKWVLECVPPDGDPLDPNAANELFGRLTCWQLIKDTFALTPGLMDVFLDFCPLERSIR